MKETYIPAIRPKMDEDNSEMILKDGAETISGNSNCLEVLHYCCKYLAVTTLREGIASPGMAERGSLR
ncbi:MAG: hypothetical protein ACUBOA_05910 [Candidatus Loosdrechtia sp.]|uniref:hypothetical protein n=1 Tax=Candidatus Loosdrechtia sp. TaxID=3101272 RepID=UPI003A7066F8|nr:MAG: hypothetical protein QY305_10600 [Candidatus Jettenia sp. AMX2]